VGVIHMAQRKLFPACNFLGESHVYMSNSTLMTTWGSRWLGETWVTCFLLPSVPFSLLPIGFGHILSSTVDKRGSARLRIGLRVSPTGSGPPSEDSELLLSDRLSRAESMLRNGH
jgi:hypothetical protein